MLYDFEYFPEEDEIWKQAKLSENPLIHQGAVIRDSRLGSWTEIGRGTHIVESEIGDYTYDAGSVSIIYSTIGKFCSIASHTRINPGNHASWRVTQHHSTYRARRFGFAETDDEEFFQWRREHSCNIGNDVWIGHAAVVMPGVSIATGAIIGSGAVVTKDVGPYEVAVGVPAKVIKKRFEDQIIEKILATQWWDWEYESIKERFEDLKDVPAFLEKYS